MTNCLTSLPPSSQPKAVILMWTGAPSCFLLPHCLSAQVFYISNLKTLSFEKQNIVKNPCGLLGDEFEQMRGTEHRAILDTGHRLSNALISNCTQCFLEMVLILMSWGKGDTYYVLHFKNY